MEYQQVFNIISVKDINGSILSPSSPECAALPIDNYLNATS